jgi:hypothetical protein
MAAQPTTTKTVAPATLPPALPPPLEASFTYDGPIQGKDDRNCEMCNAAAMKSCGKTAERHGRNADGSSPHQACSTCQAAKLGYCHNHAGLAKVLSEHSKDHPIDAALSTRWSALMGAITGHVDLLPPDVKNVHVRATIDQDQPDMPFAKLRIEITATK